MLLCLVSAGRGRRVKDEIAAPDAPPPIKAVGALNALASLLSPASSASAAFHVANAGALRSRNLGKAQNGLGRRMPVLSMSDEEEPPSEEASEETPDLEKLAPSITEDLLDSLFGDESIMTPAPGDEEEDEVSPIEEDALDEELIDEYVDAMEDEAKLVDAGASGDFAKAYDEIWAKNAQILKMEEEALQAEEEVAKGTPEDGDAPESESDQSLEDTPEKLEFIRSVRNFAELEEVKKKFRTHDQDVGSTKVQIAIFTKKIAFLTQHIQEHRKDISGLRGLQRLVNKRRKLLEYLLRTDRAAFDEVTQALGIRTTKLLLPKLPGARGIQQLARLEGRMEKKLTPKEKEEIKAAKELELQQQLGLATGKTE